jgi:alkylation response protein AidB-like acyl-CoA dehydrogenase
VSSLLGLERAIPGLMSSEQSDLQELAGRVARSELADLSAQWESGNDIDFLQLTKLLMAPGFLGMTIPVEHGGSGASFFDFVLVLEALAETSNPAAFLMQATCSGPVSHIIELAENPIRHEVLSRVASGESLCAMALTEPDAGSDVGAVKTRVRQTGSGQYLLNGGKIYVGGAGVADYYVVYARMGESPGTEGVIALVVSADAPGLSFGAQTQFIGTRGVPRRELIFDDCEIPENHILTEPGEFRRLMNIFNGERLHNSAMSLGTAQGAFNHAARYSTQRKQFGSRIADFQGTRWKLAEMSTSLEAVRLMVYAASVAHSRGEGNPVAASMAKYFAAEQGFKVVDMAMQIEGALGCQDGLVERAYRNLRTFRIAAGSSEMMLNHIGQHVAKVMG